MRLREFADPTKYFPSKKETERTAEYGERNQPKKKRTMPPLGRKGIPKPKYEASVNMMT